MISIKVKGSFDRLFKFLTRPRDDIIRAVLELYGQTGVEALKEYTPKDSGVTADSWYYTIKIGPDDITITWHNSNIVGRVPLAVLLQYGHGTRHGGYVQGIDYINPALRPIFESIADKAWREVSGE